MELLGDVDLMESRFGTFRDGVRVGASSVHGLHQTYHWLKNCFGHTRWYSFVTRIKWKLISFHSEIVLIMTQDRCTICAKPSIGWKSFWTYLMELLGDMGHGNLVLVLLEMVLVSMQDRCTVCAKHTIGLEIVLDEADGTPR
jgi:hypothetical protein